MLFLGDERDELSGGNSKIFYFDPDPWGSMIQFDEHIFGDGWFNHQRVKVVTFSFVFDFQKSLKEMSAMNLEISKQRCNRKHLDLFKTFFF